MTERETFVELGRAILAEGMGIEDASDSEAERMGRSWFGENLEKLREAVCPSKVLREALTSPSAVARNTVITTLFDGVFAKSIPVPTTTILNAVALYGITKLCASNK